MNSVTQIEQFISELENAYQVRSSAIIGRKYKKLIRREITLENIIVFFEDVLDIELDFEEDPKEANVEVSLNYLRSFEEVFLSSQERKLKQLQEDHYPLMRKYCHLYDDLPNFNEPERTCIVGDVQMGKTRMQVQAMIKSIMHGHKCVFVAGNLLDQRTQALFGISSINTEMASMKEKNLISGKLHVQACDISRVEGWLDPDNDTCNILVLLANGSQLEKLLSQAQVKASAKGLEPFEGSKPFDLYLDEADKCLTSKASKNAEISFEPMLKQLSEYAYNVVYTTATPMGVLFLEKSKLYTNKVLQMTIPDNYIGFNKLQIHFMDEEKRIGSDILALKSTSSIFKSDLYLAPMLKKFSELSAFQSAVKDDKSPVLPQIIHPRIILVKNSIYQTHHREVLNHVMNRHPCKFFTIVYDQTAQFHYHKLDARSYSVGNQTFSRQTNTSYVLKGHVHIKELISFALQHNPMRILIVSGNLANRGINFVSKDFKHHLTDQYLQPSQDSDMESIYQSLRIFGLQDVEDNTPRSLYITRQNYSDIEKYYYSREKVADILEESGDFMKTSEHSFERIVPKAFDSLKGAKISEKHWPGRRYSKARTILRKVKDVQKENSFAAEDVRVINENLCAPRELGIVKRCIAYLEDNDLHGWVRRADIIMNILHESETRFQLAAALTDAHKKHSDKFSIKATGLFVKKEGGEICMKLQN